MNYEILISVGFQRVDISIYSDSLFGFNALRNLEI